MLHELFMESSAGSCCGEGKTAECGVQGAYEIPQVPDRVMHQNCRSHDGTDAGNGQAKEGDAELEKSTWRPSVGSNIHIWGLPAGRIPGRQHGRPMSSE